VIASLNSFLLGLPLPAVVLLLVAYVVLVPIATLAFVDWSGRVAWRVRRRLVRANLADVEEMRAQRALYPKGRVERCDQRSPAAASTARGTTRKASP